VADPPSPFDCAPGFAQALRRGTQGYGGQVAEGKEPEGMKAHFVATLARLHLIEPLSRLRLGDNRHS